MSDFIKELEDLINRHSLENGSDTPDFLLANYLSECLGVYSRTVKKRDKWYNFKPWDNTITTPTKNKVGK